MPALNVGIEQEFKNLYLVSYKSNSLSGYFGALPEESKGARHERMGFDLRTIGYGMKVAKARGNIKVGTTKIPALKIESEGADPKKSQIPEMIGAPVKVGSDDFDAYNHAVKE